VISPTVLSIAVYFAGVALALVVMRDDWATRVVTALVWPLGPMALVVVVSMLVAASVILWPVPVLGLAAVASAVIYLVGC
jgi:hypothetical protein